MWDERLVWFKNVYRDYGSKEFTASETYTKQKMDLREWDIVDRSTTQQIHLYTQRMKLRSHLTFKEGPVTIDVSVPYSGNFFMMRIKSYTRFGSLRTLFTLLTLESYIKHTSRILGKSLQRHRVLTNKPIVKYIRKVTR